MCLYDYKFLFREEHKRVGVKSRGHVSIKYLDLFAHCGFIQQLDLLRVVFVGGQNKLIIPNVETYGKSKNCIHPVDRIYVYVSSNPTI